MMTCEEFASKVSDYLDGRVPYGDKMGMWIHKLVCAPCRNYLRQMQELVVFVQDNSEAPDIPINDDLRSDLMEKFRDARSSRGNA